MSRKPKWNGPRTALAACAAAAGGALVPGLVWPQAATVTSAGALLLLAVGLGAIVHGPLSRDLQRLRRRRGSGVDPIVETARGRLEAVARRLRASAPARPRTDDGRRSSPGPVARAIAMGEAVTVVTPCYNDGRFLEDCVESLRRQTMTQWRCIVVDDASTDDSLRVARRLAKAEPRVTVVRHQVNSGLPAARNTGLRLAETPFVTFLDADDMLMPESLSERIAVLRDAAHDEAVAGAFCGMVQVPEEYGVDDLPDHPDWAPPRFADLLTTRGECPFNVHAVVLPTALVRDAGGFDESMRHGAEDWELWLRLMRLGYRFRPARRIGAAYRQKRRSMVRDMPQEHIGEARRLLASVREAWRPRGRLPGYGPRPLARPLSYYEDQIQLARRILVYAGMIAVGGDTAAVRRALQALDGECLGVVRAHIDVDAFVDQGIRRALGLDVERYRLLRGDARELRETVTGELMSIERSRSAPAPPEARDGEAVVDLLLVAQSAYQVPRLLAVARRAGSLSSAFLGIDRVSGNEGAERAWEHEGIRPVSLNEWVLGGRRHRALVVMRPHGDVVAECVEATRRGGGTVHVLADPDGEMDVPEDCALLAGGQPPVDLEDLVARVTADATDHGAGVAIMSAQKGLRLEWPGATSPGPEERPDLEEYPDLAFDAESISEFRDRHRGQRCFIIGNGPSLNRLDLRRLAGELTFAVNGIFYASDRMGFDPTYYVVEDSSVMKENLEAIKRYRAGHKFFPSIYRPLVGEAPGISYFMMNRGFYERRSPHYCVPRFSIDPAQRIYTGQSVTIVNLQLAYFMGFEEVVLIGMDFSYRIPESAERRGDIITSRSDDPNHFHPDYFGHGKTWKDPKLDRVLLNYQLAKRMYEADGRRIVNATAGGRLELFERVDYDSLF